MPFNPKSIVGRKIAAVDMNATRVKDGRGLKTMHNPRITFDNGSSISFRVEEDPDGGEYGVDVHFTPAPKGRSND